MSDPIAQYVEAQKANDPIQRYIEATQRNQESLLAKVQSLRESENPYTNIGDGTPKAPPKAVGKSVGDYLGDAGVDAIKAGITAQQMVVGMADLALYGAGKVGEGYQHIGNAIAPDYIPEPETVKFGVGAKALDDTFSINFDRAKQYWGDEYYSDIRKKQEAEFQTGHSEQNIQNWQQTWANQYHNKYQELVESGASQQQLDSFKTQFNKGYSAATEQFMQKNRMSMDKGSDNLRILGDAFGYVKDNPSLALGAAMESLGYIVPSRAVSKGVMQIEQAAAKAAQGAAGKGVHHANPFLAAGVGEGTIAALAIADQMRNESADGLIGADKLAAAGVGGALTGLIGGASGKLGARLGIDDIDTIGLGQAPRNSGAASVVKPIVATTQESAEEFLQSPGETVIPNIAQGKDPLDGLAQEMSLGTFAGAIMGGTTNTPQLISGSLNTAADGLGKAKDAIKDRTQVRSFEELSNPASSYYNPAQAFNETIKGFESTDPEVQQQTTERIQQIQTNLQTELQEAQQALEDYRGMQANVRPAEVVQELEARLTNPDLSDEMRSQLQFALDGVKRANEAQEDLPSFIAVQQERLDILNKHQDNLTLAQQAYDTHQQAQQGTQGNTDDVVSILTDTVSKVDNQTDGIDNQQENSVKQHSDEVKQAVEHVTKHFSKYSADQLLDLANNSVYFDPTQKQALRQLSDVKLAQARLRDMNAVSHEVLNGTKGKTVAESNRGLVQYESLIASSLARGDTQTTQRLLDDIERWYVSHSNKAETIKGAYNAYSDDGKTRYVVPMADGTWQTTLDKNALKDVPKNTRIYTINQHSKNLSNNIASETKLISDTFKAMESMVSSFSQTNTTNPATPTEVGANEGVEETIVSPEGDTSAQNSTVEQLKNGWVRITTPVNENTDLVELKNDEKGLSQKEYRTSYKSAYTDSDGVTFTVEIRRDSKNPDLVTDLTVINVDNPRDINVYGKQGIRTDDEILNELVANNGGGVSQAATSPVSAQDTSSVASTQTSTSEMIEPYQAVLTQNGKSVEVAVLSKPSMDTDGKEVVVIEIDGKRYKAYTSNIKPVSKNTGTGQATQSVIETDVNVLRESPQVYSNQLSQEDLTLLDSILDEIEFEKSHTGSARQVVQIGHDYKYSGHTYTGKPITANVQKLLERIKQLTGITYNGVLINHYPANTKSGIGMHTDAEPELNMTVPVLSISLGDSAKFSIVVGGKTQTLTLTSGDITVFDGRSKHGITPTQHSQGRISLTFRQFKEGDVTATAEPESGTSRVNPTSQNNTGSGQSNREETGDGSQSPVSIPEPSALIPALQGLTKEAQEEVLEQPFHKRDMVKAHFTQNAGSDPRVSSPLVWVANAMQSLFTNVAKFVNKEPNTQQLAQLQHFQDFHDRFKNAIQEVLKSQYLDEAKYPARLDLVRYLKNENGNFDDNTLAAISLAVYSYLIQKGTKISNTDNDLRDLLRLEKGVTIPTQAAQLLRYAGEEVPYAMKEIGATASKALKVKVRNDADPTLQDRLDTSIGSLAMAAMIGSGLMVQEKINTTPIVEAMEQAGLSTSITASSDYYFVRAAYQKDADGKPVFKDGEPVWLNTSWLQHGVSAKDIAQASKNTGGFLTKVFGTDIGHQTPSMSKPKQFKQSSIRGTSSQVPTVQADNLTAAQQHSFTMRQNTVAVFENLKAFSKDSRFLKELLGIWVDDAVLARTHKINRDGLQAKAESEWKALENGLDWASQTRAEDGQYQEFYDTQFVSKNQRMSPDSVLFNMQASQIHRAMAAVTEFETKIDLTKLDDPKQRELLDLFMQAVGEGLEKLPLQIEGRYQFKTVDKVAAKDYVPALNAWLNENAQDAIAAMATILTASQQGISNTQEVEPVAAFIPTELVDKVVQVKYVKEHLFKVSSGLLNQVDRKHLEGLLDAFMQLDDSVYIGLYDDLSKIENTQVRKSVKGGALQDNSIQGERTIYIDLNNKEQADVFEILVHEYHHAVAHTSLMNEVKTNGKLVNIFEGIRAAIRGFGEANESIDPYVQSRLQYMYNSDLSYSEILTVGTVEPSVIEVLQQIPFKDGSKHSVYDMVLNISHEMMRRQNPSKYTKQVEDILNDLEQNRRADNQRPVEERTQLAESGGVSGATELQDSGRGQQDTGQVPQKKSAKGYRRYSTVLNAEARKAIQEFVNAGGMGVQSLQSLIALAELSIASQGDGKFTTTVGFGSDGVNNGVNLANTQMGVISPQMQTQTGLLSKDVEYNNMQEVYADQVSDYYVTFGGYMQKELSNAIEEKGRDKKWVQATLYLFKNFQEAAVNAISDGLEMRKIAKTWSVPFNYSAGQKSLKAALARGFISDVYKQLEEAALEGDKQKAQTLFTALNAIFYREAFKVNEQRKKEANQQGKTNYTPFKITNIELNNFKDALDLLEFEFSPNQLQALQGAVADLHGAAAWQATEQFAAEYMPVRDLYIEMTKAAFTLYDTVKQRLIQHTKQARDKQLSNKDEADYYGLSSKEIKHIDSVLAKMFPMLDSALSKESHNRRQSGLLVIEQSKVLESAANQRQTVTSYKYGGRTKQSVGLVKTVEQDVGVGGSALSIQSLDAYVASKLQAVVAGFNVHDAIILGLHHYKEGVQKQNEIYLEGMTEYHLGMAHIEMLVNVFTGMQSFLKAEQSLELDADPKVEAEILAELQKQLNTAIGLVLDGEAKLDFKTKEQLIDAEGNPVFKAALIAKMSRVNNQNVHGKNDIEKLQRTLELLVDLTLDQDLKKLDVLTNTKAVHQYGGEGGAVALTDKHYKAIEAQRKEIEKTRKELKKKLNVVDEMDLDNPEHQRTVEFLAANPVVGRTEILQHLRTAPQTSDKTAKQQMAVLDMVESLIPDDLTVRYEELDASIPEQVHGYFDEANNTIYIKPKGMRGSNVNAQLVIHELLHSALAKRIRAVVQGNFEGLTPEQIKSVQAAYERLNALRHELLTEIVGEKAAQLHAEGFVLDWDSLQAKRSALYDQKRTASSQWQNATPQGKKDIQSQQAKLQRDIDKINHQLNTLKSLDHSQQQLVHKLESVDEFISYGLTDQELQDWMNNEDRTTARDGREFTSLGERFKKFVLNIFGLLQLKLNTQSINSFAAFAYDTASLIKAITPVKPVQASEGVGSTKHYSQQGFNARDHVNSLNSLEVLQQLPTNVSTEFNAQLDMVIQNTIGQVYRNDGEAKQRIDEVQQVESSTAVAAGFGLSQKEQRVQQALEMTAQAYIEANAGHLNITQIRKTIDAAERQLKVQDFFQGDWATATNEQKETAQRKYNYLFRAESGKRLARFVSMAMASEEVHQLLNIKYKQEGKQDKQSWFNKVVSWFNYAVNWLADKYVRLSSSHPVNKRIAKLMDNLTTLDIKSRQDTQAWYEVSWNMLGKVTTPLNGLSNKTTSFLFDRDWIKNSKWTVVRIVGTAARLTPKALSEDIPHTIKEMRDTLKPNERAGEAMLLMGEFAAKGTLQKIMDKLIREGSHLAQHRQNLTDSTKRAIMNFFKDGGKHLTKEQHRAVTYSLLRTDIQALLSQYSMDDIIDLLVDKNKQIAVMKKLEQSIAAQANGNDMLIRAKLLAHYMVTGQGGEGLVKNTTAIAIGLDSHYQIDPQQADTKLVQQLDILTSLYAYSYISKSEKATMLNLMESDKEAVQGLVHIHSSLVQVAMEQFEKNPLSYTKGWMPELVNPYREVSFARSLDERKQMEAEGWQYTSTLKQDPNDQTNERYLMVHTDRGYQRIVSGAVDLMNTSRKGTEAINRRTVNFRQAVQQRIANGKQRANIPYQQFDPRKQDVGLIAAYDTDGLVLGYNYEMTGHTRDTYLERNHNFADLLGAYAGVNFYKPEKQSQSASVAEVLFEDYKTNYRKSAHSYVALSPKATDPKLVEMWRMLPHDFREAATKKFGQGNPIIVRNDVLHLAFGFKKYSLAQIFDKTFDQQNGLEKMFVGMMQGLLGDKAQARVAKAEHIAQEVVRLAKDMIVIRSVGVLKGNIIANGLLLMVQGINPVQVGKDWVFALYNARAYQKAQNELLELEAKLKMGGNVEQLTHEMNKVRERLDSNPLKKYIDAGLLSSIVEDVVIQQGDYSYSSEFKQKVDEWTAWIPSPIKTAASWAIVSPDTQAYQFLATTTQLSDFVAKYSLARHLEKKGASFDDAVTEASQTFINYDTPMSKGMQYANDMGLFMFTKFFLRIQAVLFKLMDKKAASVLAQHIAVETFTDVQGILDPLAPMRIGNNPFEGSVLALPNALSEIVTVDVVF